MSTSEIIGFVVIGMSSFFGLFITMNKLLIAPINELTITISKMTSALDRLNDQHDKLEDTVASHGKRLDFIDITLASNNISKTP